MEYTEQRFLEAIGITNPWRMEYLAEEYKITSRQKQHVRQSVAPTSS
jgi:hypothetical protein